MPLKKGEKRRVFLVRERKGQHGKIVRECFKTASRKRCDIYANTFRAEAEARGNIISIEHSEE